MFVFYVATVASMPLAGLVKFVPDDAFYYLKIAQNIIAGHGQTFDGESPTSGFHPLFMLLILPIAAIFEGSPEMAVRAMVILCATLFMLCAVVLSRIINSLAGRGAQALAFAAAVTAPSLVFVCIGGLETSLSLLMVLMTLHLFIKMAMDETMRSRDSLLLGALAGLAILARTDNIFLVPAFMLGFMAAGPRSKRWLHWRNLLSFTLPPIMAALGVALWSYLSTGAPYQSSGAALSVTSQLGINSTRGGISELAHSSTNIVGDFLVRAFQTAGLPVLVAVLAFAALVFASMFSELVHIGKLLGRIRLLLPLLAHSFFLAVFYAVWFHQFQLWYLAPASMAAVFVCSLLFVGLAESVSEIWPRSARQVGALLKAAIAVVIIIAGVVQAPALLSTGLYPWQPEMLRAAEAVQRHIPPGTRLAAFNAGILGLVLGTTVVNLDGVVNNRVLPFLARRNLDQYLAMAGIGAILDYQYSFYSFARATTRAGYQDFELVAELPGTWHGTNIWACRRKRGAFLEASLVRLASGFYPPEHWVGGDFEFRWSEGDCSRLSILPATTDVDLELVVLAYPLEVAGHHGQRVTVGLNGGRLGSVIMAPGWHKYVLTLPAGKLTPGPNTLTFRYRYTLCPATDFHGGGNDRRNLAVAFRAIRCQRKKRSMAIAAPSSLFRGTSRSAESFTSCRAFSTAIPSPAFLSRPQSEMSSPMATISSLPMPRLFAICQTACHFSPSGLRTSSALAPIVRFLTMWTFNSSVVANLPSAS
ncbi:MAG: hypothetical protein DRH70_00635 [Candidatus Coatesbacteria bacterium]|nr:MAG: hypothetical protein DRH70_00635 [Candidatus Coatesbacteria bacterium]